MWEGTWHHKHFLVKMCFSIWHCDCMASPSQAVFLPIPWAKWRASMVQLSPPVWQRDKWRMWCAPNWVEPKNDMPWPMPLVFPNLSLCSYLFYLPKRCCSCGPCCCQCGVVARRRCRGCRPQCCRGGGVCVFVAGVVFVGLAAQLIGSWFNECFMFSFNMF